MAGGNSLTYLCIHNEKKFVIKEYKCDIKIMSQKKIMSK